MTKRLASGRFYESQLFLMFFMVQNYDGCSTLDICDQSAAGFQFSSVETAVNAYSQIWGNKWCSVLIYSDSLTLEVVNPWRVMTADPPVHLTDGWILADSTSFQNLSWSLPNVKKWNLKEKEKAKTQNESKKMHNAEMHGLHREVNITKIPLKPSPSCS